MCVGIPLRWACTHTLAEMEYQRQAGAKAKGFLQKLQTDRWEPDQVTRYKESRGRLATRYGPHRDRGRGH